MSLSMPSLMNRLLFIALWSFLITSTVLSTSCDNADNDLLIVTTTSTENSGLIDILIPEFEKISGYNVKVIAVGSGAAIRMGRRGDVDVLLIHAPDAEKELIESGLALERVPVMKNWFVLVGSEDDIAGIKGMEASLAFNAIAQVGASFVSRGDNSGTHMRELRLWENAGFDEAPKNEEWYVSSGQGMAATLTIASEKGSYTLADRGTYLATSSVTRLVVLVNGGEGMENIYSVILLNPERLDINNVGARAFRDFMVSDSTRMIIHNFGVEKYGESLFTPLVFD